MATSTHKSPPLAAECKSFTVEGGLVTILKGTVTLEMIHAWMDKIVSFRNINWMILDFSDLVFMNAQVRDIAIMGLKKLRKKGMKRLVMVKKDPDVFKIMQFVTKKAGVFSMAEYIDVNKKSYNQAHIITYLKENWDKPVR